jgi:UDP-N-acetylglucosamine/UDP-N-acetyl-alpha-D-glucosaminouronate 4-epimerase
VSHDWRSTLLRQVGGGAPRWLVTGGAGFIGSHLVEALLRLGQRVRVLDNYATSRRETLGLVLAGLPPDAAARLEVVEGDIRDEATCRAACDGVAFVLHQAALGSVPRSIEAPLTSHAVNVTGSLNVLEAARSAGVRRVVYASSSSVYGDDPTLPKVEDRTGRQLSPYAVTKFAVERYAAAYAQVYGLPIVGLRYFNVFGPRQDPEGPYAAVMPRWFSALLAGREVAIFGDGETSRDFCYVENVVQANLLAATVERPDALGLVYNVACGDKTSLTRLFELIREQVARHRPEAASARAVYKDFRGGDIRHSLADITRARTLLGYLPTHTVAQGLGAAAAWYAGSTGEAP